MRIDRTRPFALATDLRGPDGRYRRTNVTVGDRLSGLVRVEALALTNARLAPGAPLPRAFSPPTTADVVVWLEPIDPAQPIAFSVRATDAAGNTRTLERR